MDRYLIVSADCHAGCEWEGYREYLDPQYRDRFDAWVVDTPGRMQRMRERMGGDLFDEEFLGEFTRESGVDAGGITGAWDPERRIRELEADGVVAEVIFPDGEHRNGPPFDAGLAPDTHEPELTLAGSRAYNRWLVDLCSYHPGRHAGVALLTVDDIETTVSEIQWAQKAGLRGVLIPSIVGDLPFYNHPRYEPIWATCEELDMPVHTHSGGTPAYGNLPGSTLMFLTEVSWYAHRPWWAALWSGVFERHPKLKFVMTEQGSANWVPETLAQMDEFHQGPMFGGIRRKLSLKPSEYWARQCYVGASFMKPRDSERRHAMGINNIMWGSDYPHMEGTWPHTKEKLHQTFGNVPESEARPILGETAARVYGFDVEALAPIAERVGPRIGEL